MTIYRRFAYGLIPLFLAPLLFVGGGCSKAKSNPAGTCVVRGKVTYQGKALAMGMVEFWNGDGPVGRGDIHDDGTYEASGLAEGNYQICVVTSPVAAGQTMQVVGGGREGSRPGGPPGGPPKGPPGRPGGPGTGPPGKPGPPGVGGVKPPGAGPGDPVHAPPAPGELPELPPGMPKPELPPHSKGGITGRGGLQMDPLDLLPKDKRKYYEEVQAKYGTVLSSKLLITVQPGEQTHDLKLD
jgi:hypothetical protein